MVAGDARHVIDLIEETALLGGQVAQAAGLAVRFEMPPARIPAPATAPAANHMRQGEHFGGAGGEGGLDRGLDGRRL
ncbi:hypothetical protein [Rhizobium terrae]|uniref:hypothetical protein n=1 Tax=Rhizobium terrae TaxID=2171756 RepID=UPI000E3E17A0|nr:hypothetical protein [Rhizobium terrae]